MATLFWKVFLLFAGILPAVRGRSQRMNVVGNRLNFMFGRNRIVSVRGENEDEMRQQLMQSEARLTGGMLRELLLAKFGREYDLRLTRRRDSLGKKKIYLQIMWKFLGQKSFPMTEEEYVMQLDSVADKVNSWGAAEEVMDGIEACDRRPKVDTAGGVAIMIPLDTVDADVV
mmetsp:Transcript_16131/g.24335  ORF Transcript_16131/g.24335 Transcript_16131/m.24335 type:complete len:172 (+) Transcript_16131:42-557(+)